MSDKQYDNRNKGVLFKNTDKRDDRDPVYRGNINIDGKEFWLDAWLNKTKKDGSTYMSLLVKPKISAENKNAPANPPSTAGDGFDDNIPF